MSERDRLLVTYGILIGFAAGTDVFIALAGMTALALLMAAIIPVAAWRISVVAGYK